MGIKEYPLEEEDCILVHGLIDARTIMNTKVKLIDRITNYQYSFDKNKTLSVSLDKELGIVYSFEINTSRLLIDRLFKIENKLYNIS
jgi:hypothetical protein